jgi:hypothetical protein
MFSFDVFQQVQLLVCPAEVTVWWGFGEKLITAFNKNRIIRHSSNRKPERDDK